MVIEISTFGSCSSRNIFNTNVNPDYKSYFRINHSVETVNMISLMSKPIDFDEKLLNSSQKYDNVCIWEDLTKDFRKTLKTLDVDYLIIDTYFDVFQPVYKYQDSFVSKSSRIKKTDFNDLVKDCEYIDIFSNTEEYMELWRNAYEEFFKLIESCNNDMKVILNCSRSIYKYYKGNELIVNPNFRKKALKMNPFRDKLDKIIMENYDVEVMPFDMTTLTDVNHIFNIHPTHYEIRYYLEKNQQLLEIDKRNRQLDFNDEINVAFRRTTREKAINEFALERTKRDNDKQKKKIKELKKENSALKSQLNSMTGSNSWKITEPLRKLKNSLRK